MPPIFSLPSNLATPLGTISSGLAIEYLNQRASEFFDFARTEIEGNSLPDGRGARFALDQEDERVRRLVLVGSYSPMTRALTRGLEEEGYRVANGHELAEFRPEDLGQACDGLVLDLRAREDGSEFVRRWQRLSVPLPLAVLVGSDEQAATFRTCRNATVMIKPFAFQVLLDRLEILFAMR